MGDLVYSFPSGTHDQKKRRKILHSCDRRDWSELPKDVLFDIMDRLTVIDDYVRFGAVCRPWRTVFAQDKPENANKRCCQPFLLIASKKTRQATKASLYSLSTKRLYRNFHFRLPGNVFFRGSSFGWLATMERKDKFKYKVQLQNPFLSKDYIIRLPPLDDLQRQHVDIEGWDGYYLCKAVLSSDPLLSNDFVVMAIMSRFRGLAFYKSGDTAWTSIGDWIREWDREMFHDVVFFSRTQQFYALRYNGQVVAIHFQARGTEEPRLLQVVPPVALSGYAVKAYLVEDLSGDLLMVSKCTANTCQPTYKPAYRLTVHKLDHVQGKWNEIHNLGDSVLFLGTNSSMARSLSDCPGCQPNSIYFTEDMHSSYPGKPYNGPPATGIYNLGDNTTRAHYGSGYSTQILSGPIWLEPTVFPSIYGV